MFDRFRYHHEVRPDFLPDQTKRRQGNVRAFGTRGWVVARRVHSPPFQGGVAAPLIRRSRSLAAQTGWFVISNKIRIAARAYKEATRLFTNHPGRCAATPPLKGGECHRFSKLLASHNHQNSDVYAHYIHSFRNVSDSSD